ncbi:alpha/beta hydrolase [Streptomyces muensis]|uniref:Alpha/beta hydrolase n=1 Tax=Streptomyces muensis TaxID=1077944 RepID=A0A9X1PU38_STRM4|nr:alpha/beta hydrolase [Streptomyces muensis]MCF1592289.1 alpha/beta hydrolase [Streptomyces muensis]
MSPELAALAGQIMAALPAGQQPPPPPARPQEGQSREAWLAEVAAVRGEHDAHAAVLAVHVTTQAAPAVESVTDLSIPVEGGDVTARVYRPAGQGPFPAVVFFHGGAWWLAGGERGFDLTDGHCRTICDGLGSVVINVDYRLAPENPYPGQLRDAYAAACWVVENATELGVDCSDVSVMGASSGGNLAAAVCLLARDEQGPRFASQVLLVPALDLAGGSESMREVPGQWEALQPVLRLYASPEQVMDPYVSPLLADSMEGLPPAVIVTGDHDPLRDDGRRYVARLAADGVPVRHLAYPMLHNIALPETSERMFADVIEATAEFRSGRGA